MPGESDTTTPITAVIDPEPRLDRVDTLSF
jgi:hypothetical protein